MTNRLFASLAPLLALVLPPTALAQDSGGNGGVIVVEGESPQSPEVVRDVVQRLADEHGRDVPTTRYHDALCISVNGLNAAGNDFVRARMAENAQQVGVDVREPGCRGNALVLIHDEPAEVIAMIRDQAPWLLPPEQENKVDRAMTRGEQVLVWHNEEPRNMGGRHIVHSQSIPGDTFGVHNIMQTNARVNSNGWPRRNSLEYSSAVVSAVVLLDAEIVEGMDIVRLADYATMRLLAPNLVPTPERNVPASVTSPFPDEAGPQGLTRFDAAYLEALYSLPPNAPALRMAGAVARAYDEGSQDN